MSYPYNRRVGVDYAALTLFLEFFPNGQMKKWSKRRWVMIDENEDYVTRSKLK